MLLIVCTIILSLFNSASIFAATSTEANKAVEQEVSTQQAAPSNTSQTNVIPGMSATNPQKVFGSLSLGYSSNLYDKDSYQSKMESSIEALVNFRVSGAHVLRGYMGASQDQTQGHETHVKDGFMAWVNDGFWHRGDIITIGQQVRAAVPLSKESTKRDEKITGVSVAPVAMFNLTPVGFLGVILIYQPMVTKNFHKYETSRAYRTNNEYGVSQLFRALWSFTEKAYLLSDFIYRNAWSYGGVRKDDTTDYSLSVGYALTQALSISAGVSTQSTIRNLENGPDQNVKFFDSNTSSVFGGLNYVF